MGKLLDLKTIGEQTENDDLRLLELIGSIFYYGDFIAETVNEKELQRILEKKGYFFTDEDDMLIVLYGEKDGEKDE